MLRVATTLLSTTTTQVELSSLSQIDLLPVGVCRYQQLPRASLDAAMTVSDLAAGLLKIFG
jgi:hypothetical protein